MFNSLLKSLGGSDAGATSASDDHASTSNRNTVQGDSGSGMHMYAAGASASGVGGGGTEMAVYAHGVGGYGGADGSFASETPDEDGDFLVQFPLYGTNDVTKVASYGEDDDGYGGIGSGDGMTAARELADESTHGGGETAATTATITATAMSDDLSSSLRHHSRQSSFAGSVAGGSGSAPNTGSGATTMAGAAAAALFDLSVLLPAASANPYPQPPPSTLQRRSADAAGQRDASAAGIGRENAGMASATNDAGKKPVTTNQKSGDGTKQQEKKTNQYVPWDDDDDMDLWRSGPEDVTIPASGANNADTEQRVGSIDDPHYYYENTDHETMLPASRPYIRDWSAVAIAAVAAAPMQQQPRLPTTGRRGIRASQTESVGGGSAEDYPSPQSQKQLRQLPTNSPGQPTSSVGGGDRELSNQEDDTDDPLSTRRHWMPDRLCRHCYSCESQFTVFRRRHHCRLCGQVFCAACSAHFINVSGQADIAPPPVLDSATSAGSTTLPTVAAAASTADLAASVASEPSPDGHDHQGFSSGIVSPTALSSLAVASGGQSQQSAATAATASHRMIRTCKMCYDQVTEAESGGSGALFGRPTVPPPTTPSLQTQGAGERGVGILQSHLRPEGASENMSKNSDEDPQVEELARQVEAEYAAALVGSSQAKTGGGVVHPGMLTSDAISSEVTSSATKSQSGERPQIASANRRLGMAAADHLEKMGKELLLSDAPLLLAEIGYTQGGNLEKGGATSARAESDLSRWISTLMMHATRCVQTVQQDVKGGDLLDIRPYCKVKGEHAGLNIN